MKNNKLWAFLAAMTLALLVCETAVFAATIKTKDYWVMEDGYNEQFVAGARYGDLTVTYGKYSRIAGDVYHVEYPGLVTHFLNYDAAGTLNFYGSTFDDVAYGTQWRYIVDDPRGFRELFPAVMETGKPYNATWQRKEYSDGYYSGDGSENISITVHEELGVSVPAGEFDTYRIEMVNSWKASTGDKGTTYRTYWVAKGIGWVKMNLGGIEYKLQNPPPVPPLSVTPASLTLSEGGAASLSISGGTGPYTAASSDLSIVGTMAVGSVAYVEGYVAGSAIIMIQDSASESVSVPVTVNPPPVTSLTATPSSLTLSEGGAASLSISGGTAPYSAASSNPSIVSTTAIGSVAYVEGYVAGSAIITIQDSLSNSISVPVTVNPATAVPSPPVLQLSTSGLAVTLAWDAVEGATGYILGYSSHYSETANGWGDVGLQRYFWFELPGGSGYYVWIFAYNSVGWSDPSNIESFVLGGSLPLVVNPSSLSVKTEETVYGAISGGVGYYGAYSSDTNVAQVSVSGSTLNVVGVTEGSATVTVYDGASTVTMVEVTVRQDPELCSYILSPTSQTFSSSGGSGSVSVSALTGCAWSASSNNSWITIVSGGSGNGTGTVSYSVSANPSTSSRTGTMTIGGQTFTVTQDGLPDLGMTFVLIPAGTFTMGSPPDEPGRWGAERPQHQVTLTQPFYMQQTEVTQSQWEAVMGSNPSDFSGCPSCPVEKVSWDDVQTYISYMNARGEGTYGLPTEAQWEYAARAGSTTAFYNGGITFYSDMYDCNYDGNLAAIGWYCDNSNSQTHPVAQKTPNAWGLYDMSGNVFEWCQDWFSSSYYDSNPSTDPVGPSSGSYRVLRGGGWSYSAKNCRSAFRNRSSPDYRSYHIGFRLKRQP